MYIIDNVLKMYELLDTRIEKTNWKLNNFHTCNSKKNINMRAL